MATVPRGHTCVRIRYGWWASATSSTLYSAPNLMENAIAVGVISGAPATSYVPPNPYTSPSDPAPPLNRWLWWEVRSMEPRTWGNAYDDVATWRDTGPVEPNDIKSQVRADTVPGQDLGIFLSWGFSRSDWPNAGYASLSAWWSVLVDLGGVSRETILYVVLCDLV